MRHLCLLQILAIGVGMNTSKELKGVVGKHGKFNVIDSYDDLEKIDLWVMKHICKPGKVPVVVPTPPPQKKEREFTCTYPFHMQAERRSLYYWYALYPFSSVYKMVGGSIGPWWVGALGHGGWEHCVMVGGSIGPWWVGALGHGGWEHWAVVGGSIGPWWVGALCNGG